MSLADRATIANMAPEYGATMGFFPVDSETLVYMRRTGRTSDEIELVERYCKEQGLFLIDGSPELNYTKILTLDLESIEPSMAGPKRPQDRVALKSIKTSFVKALSGDFSTVAHQADQSLPTMAFNPIVAPVDTQPPPPFIRQQQPKPTNQSRFGIFAFILGIATLAAIGIGTFTYFNNPPTVVEQTTQPTEALPAPNSPDTTPKPSASPEQPKDEPVVVEPRKPTIVEPFDTTEYAVRITTVPATAKIIVDSGSPTCTSPCSLTLPPGRHTFSASLSGHQSAFRVFQVPDQTELNVPLQPSTGQLSIVTTPAGSEIMVDGAVKSERSPAILILPTGKHRIRITTQGHDPREQEIEIREGGISEFRITW